MKNEKYVSFQCPIVSVRVESPCGVKSCMYHLNSIVNRCGYNTISTIIQKESTSKDSKISEMCKIYSIEEDDLRIATKRIVAVMCASEFFTHVFDKTIMEAHHKELEKLTNDEDRYNSWREGTKKVSFEELVTAIEFLKTNLR